MPKSSSLTVWLILLLILSLILIIAGETRIFPGARDNFHGISTLGSFEYEIHKTVFEVQAMRKEIGSNLIPSQNVTDLYISVDLVLWGFSIMMIDIALILFKLISWIIKSKSEQEQADEEPQANYETANEQTETQTE